jgi:hypothetical protein
VLFKSFTGIVRGVEWERLLPTEFVPHAGKYEIIQELTQVTNFKAGT